MLLTPLNRLATTSRNISGFRLFKIIKKPYQNKSNRYLASTTDGKRRNGFTQSSGLHDVFHDKAPLFYFWATYNTET